MADAALFNFLKADAYFSIDFLNMRSIFSLVSTQHCWAALAAARASLAVELAASAFEDAALAVAWALSAADLA